VWKMHRASAGVAIVVLVATRAHIVAVMVVGMVVAAVVAVVVWVTVEVITIKAKRLCAPCPLWSE
jgi:uncharacterized protein HemY